MPDLQKTIKRLDKMFRDKKRSKKLRMKAGLARNRLLVRSIKEKSKRQKKSQIIPKDLHK